MQRKILNYLENICRCERVEEITIDNDVQAKFANYIEAYTKLSINDKKKGIFVYIHILDDEVSDLLK